MKLELLIDPQSGLAILRSVGICLAAAAPWHCFLPETQSAAETGRIEARRPAGSQAELSGSVGR